MRIWIRRGAMALAVAAGLYGVGAFLWYWDYSRLQIKRWNADPWAYAHIDPELRKTDPRTLIRVRDLSSVDAVRAALVSVVFGAEDLPRDLSPDTVVRDLSPATPGFACDNPEQQPPLTLACALPLYLGADNLAAIDALRLEMRSGFRPMAALFRPENGNGRALVYAHGYAGTYHDQWRLILDWVARGDTVLAVNLRGYGDSGAETPWSVDAHLPLADFFAPVTAGINHLLAEGAFRSLDMVGLSAGGWVTAVYAAMDPRIRRSYPVAGVLPVWLRRERETAAEQLWPPLLEAASYLDMFVLASMGEGRGQMQVVNRFDRCCFAGVRAVFYEESVNEAVADIGTGGKFTLLIDETHARHKLSRMAFDAINADRDAR